ncbi:MAG: SpoIID/LytB domain-containing protein [Candidatus Gracilibacteria bacterium]|jgi:hypothetical protein
MKLKEKITIWLCAALTFSSLAPVFFQELSADAATSTTFKIIKRAEWGADESYRFLENNDSAPQLIEFSDETIQKYASELKYKKVVESDSQGRKYKWPLQYPEKVTKFVVHHTDTTKNLDDPKQAIRDIYKFHAITRGWGDIGYNYIIDQNGNIYEGRYGGDGVIGAHAGIGNNGSIGIAILGDYENNKVPSKAKKALVELIARKSLQYNINPSGKSMFRGNMMNNIFGHKDIMATACPGDNLYKQLGDIRKQASSRLKELKKSKTSNTTTVENKGPDLRVKLSFSGDPEISGNGFFKAYSKDKLIGSFSGGDKVKISYGTKYQIEFDGKIKYSADEITFAPEDGTILRIENFEHRPGWAPELNDNEYRGKLEVRLVDKTLNVINELPLEDYLKGIGEVSNFENVEKIKSIIVAARTYAKYYTEKEQKFPGKPYNLDDDPNKSQKYLGYGMEKRSPNIVDAVTATKGEIVTYNGVIVKTPYFSQSDGTFTRSAKTLWGWDAPYLTSVDDSYCSGKEFLGHGVGLSGCGAKGMAENGFKYKDILKHYYTGVEIKALY